MKKVQYILSIVFVLLSCSKEDNVKQTLVDYIVDKPFEKGGVIACAASDENTGNVFVYYYPEEGATNIRYYETLNNQIDSNNFSNYIHISKPREPVFNGYLGKFISSSPNEKWVIVTFELNGRIKISNPIRTKQIIKPTVWNDQVDINQDTSGMPLFRWPHNAFGDNAIYFQVITNMNNNLLSGTYTYENKFQYYNISNVVLNITPQEPPDLVINDNYFFTLMDVSLDNWVNLVIEKSFIAE
jgi:hypothetical protein